MTRRKGLSTTTSREGSSTATKRGKPKRTSDGGAAAGPAHAGDFERSTVRRAVVWIVAAKAAGLVLLFDPWSIQAQDLPKSLFSRATEWLLVAAVVLLLARFGLACVPRTRLHLFVAAFAAAAVLSAVFAADGYVALYGARERHLGLTFIADMLVLYAAVAIAFRSDADWRVLGVAAAAAGLVAVGYAGMQYTGLDPVRWADDPRLRPYSTFGNPDMFGHFLSVLFAIGLALAVFSPGPARSRPRLAGAALVAIGVVVAGVIATRATFIGMSAALVAAGVVYVGLRGLDRRAAVRLGVAGAVTVSLALGVLLITPLGERLGATARAVVDLAQGRPAGEVGPGALHDRLLFYDSAIRAFADRPLLGYGPDSFVVVYPAYRQPGSAVVFGLNSGQSSTHSWLLHTLVSHGVVGLVALLALIAASAVALWRLLPQRPLLAAAGLLASAAYWTEGLVSVGHIGVDGIPWVAFGAAAAASGPLPRRAARQVPAVAQAGVLAVAAALALTGLPALQAAHDAWNAQGSLSRGSADRAIAAAQSSVARDPGRADYWNRFGQALDLRGLWGQSADAYAQAARRAPYESTYWENLALTRGRLALQRSDRASEVAAALSAARTAIDKDPNAQRPHLTLAQLARAFGDQRLALTEAVNVIALGGDPLADSIAAEAAVALGDPPFAREKLETALRLRETVAMRLALAEVGLAMKEPTVARTNAARVLELDPANERAKAILRAVSGG